MNWDWVGDFWQWLNTYANGLIALLTLGAVIVAVRTLNSSKADSEERSRPIVTAELRRLPVHGAVALVVANRGVTMAHDIHVTFDPPIPEIPVERRPSSSVWYVVERYAKPVASLAPGQELSNIWRVIGAEDDEPPHQVTVRVDFLGRKKRYREQYALDLDVLLKETVIGNSKSVEAQTVEGVKQLKALVAEVKAIRQQGEGEPPKTPNRFPW